MQVRNKFSIKSKLQFILIVNHDTQGQVISHYNRHMQNISAKNLSDYYKY